MLGCSCDGDFLAKLYCVRLAFDELIRSQTNRKYFIQVGKEMMVSFLRAANQVHVHRCGCKIEACNIMDLQIVYPSYYLNI